MNILAEIVASKRAEVESLYAQYDLVQLKAAHASGSTVPVFYQRLAEARNGGRPFFISEFKRKSPSEGWINQHADLPTQIRAYTQAGAHAISVLTDSPFFGGSYEDLSLARTIVNSQQSTAPLLLQKDFVLDPIQLYLAKQHGADLILLIAAILAPEQLDQLKKTAESIGLGVLVEVHDAEELEKIQHLDFPVLGINNRDLKTFRTALNRVNVLASSGRPIRGGVVPRHVGELLPYEKGTPHRMGGLGRASRYIIAESGILDYRHFQMVRNADGFLIGTGLMRKAAPAMQGGAEPANRFVEHFQAHGKFLFKACGIRTEEILSELNDQTTLSPQPSGLPDFIGINFSPVSKRLISAQVCAFLDSVQVSNYIAVFYKNKEAEILETLEKYPFKTVQLYAGDVSPDFVRSLKTRVMMAVKWMDNLSWVEIFRQFIEPYAADVDCFILDGATPGSGTPITAQIPIDFPYPFLLAGGMHEDNLETIAGYENCIGVDIASGIESEGAVDLKKIKRIAQKLVALSLPHELPDRL